MVKANENTLGGRIRKARLSKKLKIKELASILQINPNYLGMVELNKKIPSKKLLERISEETDASYGWLSKGPVDGMKQKTPAPPPRHTVASVDLPLLLSIIIAKSSFTKESIAPAIGINPADVDDIISGKDCSHCFDPSWENILSGLTQRMDLDDVIEQMQILTKFLQDKREEMDDWKLSNNLKRYINEELGVQYPPKSEIRYAGEPIRSIDDGDSVYLYPKQIIFDLETVGRFTFIYYKYDGRFPTDAYTVETFLLSPKALDADRLSIVLDDADLYHTFRISYEALYKKASSDSFSEIMRIASIIYVNKATMEISEAYPPDSGEPLQDEAPDDLS